MPATQYFSVLHILFEVKILLQAAYNEALCPSFLRTVSLLVERLARMRKQVRW